VVIASTPHHEAPRIAYPRAGATLLAPEEAAPEITLRATAAGEPVDARFELDGRRLASPTWRMTRGRHVLVAMLDGRRSEETEFEVVGR
jgi:hypothetical protein